LLRAFRSAEWTRKAAVLGPLDDAQTCAFDIVLMPEGNRDMETILAKKSLVYTVRGKNFEAQHH
jgi:hypothetical protein